MKTWSQTWKAKAAASWLIAGCRGRTDVWRFTGCNGRCRPQARFKCASRFAPARSGGGATTPTNSNRCSRRSAPARPAHPRERLRGQPERTLMTSPGRSHQQAHWHHAEVHHTLANALLTLKGPARSHRPTYAHTLMHRCRNPDVPSIRLDVGRIMSCGSVWISRPPSCGARCRTGGHPEVNVRVVRIDAVRSLRPATLAAADFNPDGRGAQ